MASTASFARGSRRTQRRSWALATAALGTIVLAATAAALGTRLVAVWPGTLSAGGPWSTPGALAIDTLVAVPLLATGAAAAAWWAGSLLLITISLAADRAGRHSAALVRCIHAVAPRTLRGLAVAGAGAGLAFSTLPAQAAPVPPDVGWTTTQEFAGSGPAQPADAGRATPGTALPSIEPEPVPGAPGTLDPEVPLDQDRAAHAAPPDPTSLGAVVPLVAVPAPPEAATTTGGEGPPVTPPPASSEPAPRDRPAAQAPSAQAPSAPEPSARHPAAQPQFAEPSTAQPGAREGRADRPGSSGSAPGEPAGGGPRPAQPGSERADLAAGVVVVARGDTLWGLAAEALHPGANDAEIATSWHAWYELNRAVIGEDPNLLHPGQLLQAPPRP